MPEVHLEFLGRQIALILEGQREMKADIGTLKADMATVKATLAETASRDLLLRGLRSFEGRSSSPTCARSSCARPWKPASGPPRPASTRWSGSERSPLP